MLVLCALHACDTRDDFVAAVYDTCFLVDNCVVTANLCEELTVDFAGQSFTNAICTLTCEDEGPIAADCPRAFVGRNGSCYPSSAAGGPDDTLVCLEPCDVTEDCFFGFRCLGAVDLCGADPSCPIAPGDRLCVPGP